MEGNTSTPWLMLLIQILFPRLGSLLYSGPFTTMGKRRKQKKKKKEELVGAEAPAVSDTAAGHSEGTSEAVGFVLATAH